MKVKSESEVTQSCLTLSDPMDRSLPGSSIYGIFQARVLEWGAIALLLPYLKGMDHWLLCQQLHCDALDQLYLYSCSTWESKLIPGVGNNHLWLQSDENLTKSAKILSINLALWALSSNSFADLPMANSLAYIVEPPDQLALGQYREVENLWNWTELVWTLTSTMFKLLNFSVPQFHHFPKRTRTIHLTTIVIINGCSSCIMPRLAHHQCSVNAISPLSDFFPPPY